MKGFLVLRSQALLLVRILLDTCSFSSFHQLNYLVRVPSSGQIEIPAECWAAGKNIDEILFPPVNRPEVGKLLFLGQNRVDVIQKELTDRNDSPISWIAFTDILP